MISPNILIVIPKYDFTKKKFYHYLFPTGYAYIIASLKQAGYKVEALNLNHTEGNITDVVLARLKEKKYKYFMIGGLALDYHSMKLSVEALDKLDYKPITIMGGSLVTTMPIEMLEDMPQVDYGTIGEAEETIVDLIDTLEKNGDVTKVTGIVYRSKE